MNYAFSSDKATTGDQVPFRTRWLRVFLGLLLAVASLGVLRLSSSLVAAIPWDAVARALPSIGTAIHRFDELHLDGWLWLLVTCVLVASVLSEQPFWWYVVAGYAALALPGAAIFFEQQPFWSVGVITASAAVLVLFLVRDRFRV